MPGIVLFQTNFSSGELDPLLRARTDLEQYQNALEEATNVVVQPQGGVRRRDGTKFVYDFGSSFTKFKLISFEYSTTDSYMLVVVAGRIYVFKAGVLQTNINSSGNDYITATAITAGMIDELNFTQAVDTLILVHEDLEPQRLVRNSDTSWTLGALPLSYIPQYAFTISTTAGTSYTHDHLEPSGSSGNITLEAHATGGHSASNIFTSSASTYIGQYITVTPFGRLRVVDKISDSKLSVYCETPLFDNSDIPAANWEFETGYEDTWSASRGWPRSTSFHESRLYFGGTTTRPNTIWGSRVVDFFNFDPGTALDDEAVEATINTNQLNVINHIISGPDLQIFTTGGEFIVSQPVNEPVTPSSFLIKRQTSLGSRAGIPIEDLDGATIFIQRQGKSITSFQFRDTTASYGTQPLSVLSSHLLKDPVDMAARRSSSTDETDRLYIVNGEDGSMAVYSILASQNVVAPSRFTTNGEYIAVGVEVATTFVVVKRNINGTDVYYLEQFDESVTTDSALTGGAASSVNVTHLEGEEVDIIRDGVVEAAQTVPATPFTVTFDRAATSSYEVGLDFTVTIKTMPAEPRMSGMSVQGVKKRILQVDALLFETQNMKINDQLVAFRQFGAGVLDEPVEEFTGTKTLHSLLGYSTTGQITVTQSNPLKLTLLGMEYKMSVGA